MMLFVKEKRYQAVFLLLFLLVAVACGRKAPPVPPEMTLPQAPQAVTVMPVAGGYHIRWQMDPGAYKGFRIYRAVLPEEECTECPLTYALRGEVGPRERGFTDRAPEERMRYRVVAFLSGGAQGAFAAKDTPQEGAE